MTREAIRSAWREVEACTSAASFLLQHADGDGPLADRATADPSVRAVMNARRHLLTRAHRLRAHILATPTTRTDPDGRR